MNGFKYVVSMCVKIEYLCQNRSYLLSTVTKAVHISNDKKNQDFEVLDSICFRIKTPTYIYVTFFIFIILKIKGYTIVRLSFPL